MADVDIIAFFIAVPIAVLTALFVYFIRAESKKREPELDEATAKRHSTWKHPRTAGYWISTILLSGVYIMAGLPKLTDFSDVLHRFSEWGYSSSFLHFIGGAEFIAGILLIVPQTAPFAASFLAIIMGGAIYTHLAFDPAWYALLPAFCLSGLAFVAYESWERVYADRNSGAAQSQQA